MLHGFLVSGCGMSAESEELDYSVGWWESGFIRTKSLRRCRLLFMQPTGPRCARVQVCSNFGSLDLLTTMWQSEF